METQKDAGKPLLTALRELEVGESLSVPAERGSYLKSISSQFGFEWGKKFTCSNNRDERTITATRTA